MSPEEARNAEPITIHELNQYPVEVLSRYIVSLPEASFRPGSVRHNLDRIQFQLKWDEINQKIGQLMKALETLHLPDPRWGKTHEEIARLQHEQQQLMEKMYPRRLDDRQE